MSHIPKLTLKECDTILCGVGMPHEMETRVIEGRVQRVYKNLWPSLRAFWLWAAAEYRNATYVVYENKRLTYGEVLTQSLQAALIFKDVYHVEKGDRVAICSRNVPEYLVAWWGCHLLGAVPVLVNAWLPVQPLLHCLTHTQSKIVIVDVERLERIAKDLPGLRSEGITGVLLFESSGRDSNWTGIDRWTDVMHSYQQDPNPVLEDLQVQPEDNATIIFTSGTTGLPKGVLSTQRQFLTNVRNATVASSRAHLRRGDGLPIGPEGPQGGLLVSVPFFHVTGITSLTMLATSAGLKVVLMRKWDLKGAIRLIRQENVRVAGGVPSMVSELLGSSLAGYPLESLLFGGASAQDQLPKKAKDAFPNTMLSQAYGMTETNSIAVGIAGEDYEARPTSAGLPCPVNDVLIVDDGRAVPPGRIGEIWLRGPNIMQEYWHDAEATARTVTRDGWIKTGDLGTLDEEGFLYVRDRIKDMIIRGGENIASVTVENALYHDERLAEVAAVGVPDEKLGELVAVVVSTKPAFHKEVKERELIDLARSKLPYFAVPVMVIIQDKPFELTPSGKIVKGSLRVLAKAEWARRKGGQNLARL